MALGSTQPLTEMSTRDTSWRVKGAGVRLTTLPRPCAGCLTTSGSLNLLGPVQACTGIGLPYKCAVFGA